MTDVASQPDNVIEMAGPAAGMTANLTSRCFDSPSRSISPFEWERFEASIAEIFTAFGLDLATPGTRDTPKRFLKALYDITAGYDGDPKLATSFPAERGYAVEAAPSQIIEGPIDFNCLCEHHALPFFGTAFIGYIAGDQIIGISKLTRLVRLFARRFTVQERLGEQVADGLTALIEPRGVAVHLEAAHLCTHVRGVAEHSRTTTTVWRGEFSDAELRREFLAEVRTLRRDR
ncbi:GTP cyclohydrolase I [Mycobacterium sp. TY814]|uniref:GTP cyclohydrolase I n=1 Tax=unclassified Mycobacterium TaxID=2642494 RepID=UPI000FC2E84E|nr:GTP cyclohydrolase I [Mycobacterium sp. TY814]MDP7720696.1 GTP cyclohydrolase I [Mycobacterium sp. TY814]RUP03347.1 MAG: GTP cyclohydrolase I [Mycobacterium sp.]